MKISPIIKPNQNKVNINENYKAIVNSNTISKTKETYNKKSNVVAYNSETQKQIIDIAFQKLIRIFKDMTKAENARKSEIKRYVKNNKIAKKNKNYQIITRYRIKIKINS